MKLSIISAVLTMSVGAVGANAVEAVTLSFHNSTEQTTKFGFLAGKEFLLGPSFDASSQLSYQKDTIKGGERWEFDNRTNQLISVSNTATTTGATATYVYTGASGFSVDSASPNGDLAIDSNADLFGEPFGFLAPTEGSAAGDRYGVGRIDFLDAENFTVFFPVLEAQWHSNYLTLGQASGGVTLSGIIDPNDNSFVLFGAERINRGEDLSGTGFANWTASWLYVGTIADLPVNSVPIPAAAWLFGSGLLGLIGLARIR